LSKNCALALLIMQIMLLSLG